MQLSEQYRLINHSLYKLNSEKDAYIHVCLLPPHIKTLSAAIKYYENMEA